MSRVEAKLVAGVRLTGEVYVQGLRMNLPILDGTVRFEREGLPPMRMEGLFVKAPGGWCMARRNAKDRPLELMGRVPLEES